MNNIALKWKPVLDNFFKPYELEDEIIEMLANYTDKNLEVNYSTLSGRGMGSVNPTVNYPTYQPSKSQEEVVGVLMEFKERLSQDIDIRIDVKNVYYNSIIKRIVYELVNGDSVYLETKPLVLKDSSYIEKSKKLFLTISEPKNPQVRRIKIENIKSKVNK